jgi:uncharacterized membrane protein
VAIYWNNHHHLLHTAQRVNGAMLWANMHLLFWLSLIPLTTDWLWQSHFAAAPTAMYGAILLMAAIAYFILQKSIISMDPDGSLLKRALGTDIKGKLSPALYVLAILVSFISPLFSQLIYVGVALMWLIPDRRIEKIV